MSEKRKVLVLGVDGMNPVKTNQLMAEGKMPNFKKILDRGAAREDLMLLGANPTITPPQWTTLATGAYPMTHSITDFWRQDPDNLDRIMYNLDSRLCQAEQLWNVTAEAGYKTLVYHWPGSAWPPSSDSENLYVIDGTSPGNMGNGTLEVSKEFIVTASEECDVLKFSGSKSAEKVPCVVNVDLDVEKKKTAGEKAADGAGSLEVIIIDETEGMPAACGNVFYEIQYSPVKEAKDWANAPADAKEFTILFQKGLVRRPALILKNESGIYDSVAIYKSKKEENPFAVLHNQNALEGPFIDTQIYSDKNDKSIRTSFNMRILNLDTDGSKVQMWISAGMDTENDTVFHPQKLHPMLTEALGPVPPTSIIGAQMEDLHVKCQTENWEFCGVWQAAAINKLIDEEGIEVVFSHLHNVDLQEHSYIKYVGRGTETMTAEKYDMLEELTYGVTDRYLGRFLHRLDEGWTIFIVSDHGLVSPLKHHVALGDNLGVSVNIMEELGLTAVKRDENGNRLPEIDWENTKAVAVRSCHIYVNLKGRDKHGIVDPADKYEVEEEIMTKLYGYTSPVTGHRVVALALRNKDAVVLGLGGPECGDIIYFTAEGYNHDHGDGMSTADGLHHSSLSPIFVAAGAGIKENFKTTRVIRQVDVAPTIATLLGTRMPYECEGAPVYQILV